MKKNHLLLTFCVMFFGLSLVLMSDFVAAQNATDDDKQVKIKIRQNINGETKTIEKTFSDGDEAALEELLKEFNIDLNSDDFDGKRKVEISIRKTMKDAEEEANNVVIDVEKMVGGDDAQTRAFLGVFTAPAVNENGETGKGVEVTEVVPGSAAEKAELKEGDVILAINDVAITGTDQLREVIRSHKPEEAVTVRVAREGKEQDVKAVLEGHKMVREFHCVPNGALDWNGQLPKMQERPFLGIVPSDQTDKQGVVIEEVIEKSTAEEIGLKEGDVITKLNDKPVTNFGALREVLGSMKPGDEVKVEYERDGKTNSGSGKLGSKAFPEKLCVPFGPDCHARMFNEEITKENLEGAVERLEKEIQVLKKRIEVFDSDELNKEEDILKNGEEETTISITIEDAVPSTLEVSNLQFSPNPNDGKFNVSFELPQKAKTVVRIFDVSNKEIYKEDLGKFSGRYSKQIDISENPKGIYFLQITQNDKAVNKKIVIQ